MILPVLKGILGWAKAPVTWALIVVNFAVFGILYRTSEESRKEMTEYYSDEAFVGTQGLLFAQFVMRYPEQYGSFYKDLAVLALRGEKDQKLILGAMALRDILFVKHARHLEYGGDQIQIGLWKERFEQVIESKVKDPSNVFGLSRFGDFQPRTWITYQFYHGGLSHLIGNIFFLLIFGVALESELGGLAVLITFLISGVFSAAVFVALSSVSAIPLVGASGSISGLMGLYIGYNWKRPIRFFYFILPFKGYSGFLYLPAWTGLVMWLAADFSGLLATVDDMGGVAHAAHVGGMVLGLLLGFFLLLGSEPAPQGVLSHAPGLDKL